MRTPRFSNPRYEPRMHVSIPVRLRFGWRDSEEEKGSSVDISEHGMSVHCHVPLRLGMKVKAILEGAPDEFKFCRVTWVRETESTGHNFNVGLEVEPQANDTL